MQVSLDELADLQADGLGLVGDLEINGHGFLWGFLWDKRALSAAFIGTLGGGFRENRGAPRARMRLGGAAISRRSVRAAGARQIDQLTQPQDGDHQQVGPRQ